MTTENTTIKRRYRDAQGNTIRIENEHLPMPEQVITEEVPHRSGVFSETNSYVVRCESCNFSAGPFDSAAEARANEDHHAGKFSSLEEAKSHHDSVNARVVAEAEERRSREEADASEES